MANGCSTEHLKEESDILHDHIKRYTLKNTPEKFWQIIFNIVRDLGIKEAVVQRYSVKKVFLEIS